MAEQEIGQAICAPAEFGARSSLLMPVVEGHTLESDDVSIFLGIRLLSVDDDNEIKPETRLS